MVSTVKPAKMGPHDHARTTMPIKAAPTRTTDTMDSVFTFACATIGWLESTREVSVLMCRPSGGAGVRHVHGLRSRFRRTGAADPSPFAGTARQTPGVARSLRRTPVNAERTSPHPVSY